VIPQPGTAVISFGMCIQRCPNFTIEMIQTSEEPIPKG